VPTIITATQLRGVLGVSSALYNDAYLNQIIDSAEEVIIPMLAKYSSGVSHAQRTGTAAKLYTKGAHEFLVGQTIIVDYIPIPNFNGSHTITAVTEDTISYTTNQGGDVVKTPIIPNGIIYLAAQQYWQNEPAIQSATYVVATEIFQSRTASGGQIEGVDFAPTPYRMGRSLINRVSGLLAPYIDEGTLCQ
jgi:hypothetical protein